MEKVKVKSSVIESIAYDAEKKILEIVFKRGYSHFYREVPPNFWRECMLAPSIGRFYFDNIKNCFPQM